MKDARDDPDDGLVPAGAERRTISERHPPAPKKLPPAQRRPVQETVRAGRAETVLLIILRTLWIILLAFHP